MSTDQTPALARAAETLIDRSDAYDPDDVVARKVVSAALHDPDDDVIARAIGQHTGTNTVFLDTQRCTCGWTPDREKVRRRETSFRVQLAAHQADAVRAAILGEAS